MSIEKQVINLLFKRTNDVIVIGNSRADLKKLAIAVDEIKYKPENRHLIIGSGRKIRYYRNHALLSVV